MRLVSLVALFPFLLAPLECATLQRLSLEEIIAKSTEIVRGRIAGTRTVARGPVVYTFVQVQVEESWKGSRAGRVEVAVPGGELGGVHQNFSGVPALAAGQDYMLFLWTGTNGLTQVIGLSQGVFEVKKDAKDQWVVERPASNAAVLDAETGRLVEDEVVVMRLDEMQGRIQSVLKTSAR